MRVYFLSGEWTALKRFIRGEVPFPEGMPSVYGPWLRYREKGYDVHIFIIGQFDEDKVIDFNGCNIHIVSRPSFFRWRNTKKRFRCRFLADEVLLYRAADRIAQNKPPQVVYSVQPWHSYPAWAISRKYSALCVKRIYGTWLYKNWFRNDTAMEKLSCLPHFLAWRWPFDQMIISNDGTEGDKIADLLGIAKSKYSMMINGVDREWDTRLVNPAVTRDELGIAHNTFVLLCLSRLSLWKRQDRVVQAMPAILKAIPDARLVLAGDGPMRDSLEELASNLGVRDSVIFTGMILHSKVRELMSIGDVFLQTNDLSCLGNSLLEALICGRAIVTWDAGTTSDVITDNVNGRLLPDAEPDSIARAVIDLYLDKDKRLRLAKGARKFALEDLQSWNERIDTEINLVENKYEALSTST